MKDQVKDIVSLGGSVQVMKFSNGVVSVDVEGGSGGGGMTAVTHSQLKGLRDGGKLVPGSYYRITDYVTSINYPNARVNGKQFDIVVLALSTNVLSENAQAINHQGDTYFSTSDLDTWKLGYTIDNKTDLYPCTTNGKGWIYFMEDENGNTCSYDFKCILWGREEDEPAVLKHYYTFNCTDEETGDVTDYSLGKSVYCYNNKLYSAYNEFYDEEYWGNFSNVFLNTLESYCYSNTFGDYCKSNTFGGNCYDNNFGDYCKGNTFGYRCYGNTFRNNCKGNTLGDECQSNTFGDYCKGNTFGYGCKGNTFGYGCYSNTFGYYCYSNTFGDYCHSNTFEYYCNDNTFGDDCYNNTFGGNCYNNTFGDYCKSNTFGDECQSNNFGDGCHSNTFGNYKCYNKLEDGIKNLDISSTVIEDKNTRRYYYNSSHILDSEITCYRPLSN